MKLLGEIIDTIRALFRIRYLMEIEAEAKFMVQSAKNIDDILNEDEVPPDGDTYNALWMYVSAFGEKLKG